MKKIFSFVFTIAVLFSFSTASAAVSANDGVKAHSHFLSFSDATKNFILRDENHLIIKRATPEGIINYVNTDGKRRTAIHPNGVTVVYKYDNATGLLTSTEASNGIRHSFKRTKKGVLKSITSSNGMALYIVNKSDRRELTIRYADGHAISQTVFNNGARSELTRTASLSAVPTTNELDCDDGCEGDGDEDPGYGDGSGDDDGLGDNGGDDPCGCERQARIEQCMRNAVATYEQSYDGCVRDYINDFFYRECLQRAGDNLGFDSTQCQSIQ